MSQRIFKIIKNSILKYILAFISKLEIDTLTSFLDIEKDLDNFERHWVQISDELKPSELTPNDAKSWRLNYKIQKREFIMSHYIPNESAYEIYTKFDQVKHILEIGILSGLKNYRDKEGERLKNMYGPLGEFYYWFKEILKRF